MKSKNKNTEEKSKSLIQFMKFALVGVFNTVVSFVIRTAVVALGSNYAPADVMAFPANILAFIISVFLAYLIQSRFVFKEQDGENYEKRVWWKVLLKTYAAYAFTGLFLSNILDAFWFYIVGIERLNPFLNNIINGFGIQTADQDFAVYITPLLNIVVNVPINFAVNKFWAYRQKKKSTA